jgi:hypothetical protein
VTACRLLVCAAMFASLGCEQVLGIKEAEYDPTFDPTIDAETPERPQALGSRDAGHAEAEAPDLCERYCSTVFASCVDTTAVYTTLESCLAVCALLPPGSPGDEIGNTVHCRLRAAEAAPTEPDFYCPAASPYGGGTCGSPCEALCTVAAGVCQGDDRQWDSVLSCKSACDQLPDLGTYTTSQAAGMSRGDHVQCRLFHLSNASIKDPALHCPHVGGARPCAPPDPPPDAGTDAAH